MIDNVHFPLLRNSTAVCEITDREGTVVGYIQRYHATRMQQLVNLLLDNMFNNVCACDREKKPWSTLWKSKTRGHFCAKNGLSMLAAGNSKSRTSRRSEPIPDSYTGSMTPKSGSKKSLPTRTVRFLQHNRTVAEAVPEGLMPPKSCRVAFHLAGSETDIYEIAALYYVFKLKTG